MGLFVEGVAVDGVVVEGAWEGEADGRCEGA
jgi:hypothetical protein